MPEKKGEKLPGGQMAAVRVRQEVAFCEGVKVVDATARNGPLNSLQRIKRVTRRSTGWINVMLMKGAEQTAHVTKTMNWLHSHGINATTTAGINFVERCRRNGVIELCRWHHKRHFCLGRDV